MAAQSSPFTQAVIASMRKLYPEALADKSFDNTGLMLEAPAPQQGRKNSVLLTIDLTTAVADEAIAGNHSVVVAYHPIIFRGLRSITLSDTQQASLLRLAANGVSVYSPHTAVDIVPGGMADWLCDLVTGYLEPPECGYTEQHPSPDSEVSVSTSDSSTAQAVSSSSISRPFARRTYSKPNYLSYPYPPTAHDSLLKHERAVVTSSPASSIDAANAQTSSSRFSTSNTGSGRVITFQEPQPLPALIQRIAHATGHPKAFQIAVPQTRSLESMAIKTVGVCPGSGSSVLRPADADLLFTGEMSHHEALALIEQGKVVICLGHSNSERGYLGSVLASQLEQEIRHHMKQDHDKTEVVVSRADRDPFGIVVLEGSEINGARIK